MFEMIDADGSGAIEAAEFIAPLSRWVRDSKPHACIKAEGLSEGYFVLLHAFSLVLLL